jgi:hypothetical protein
MAAQHSEFEFIDRSRPWSATGISASSSSTGYWIGTRRGRMDAGSGTFFVATAPKSG